MTAFKFAKIDLLKSRRMLWFLLLPVAVALLTLSMDNTNAVFPISYCIFIGMVFATLPFEAEYRSETGFIRMLPAKDGSDIAGHFLFGFFVLLISAAEGLVVAIVASLFIKNMPIFSIFGKDISGIYLIIFSVGLTVVGIEYLLMTIFRYKSSLVTRLIRIVPALAFYFIARTITDQGDLTNIFKFDLGIGPLSLGILAGGIVLYIILSKLSGLISSKN